MGDISIYVSISFAEKSNSCFSFAGFAFADVDLNFSLSLSLADEPTQCYLEKQSKMEIADKEMRGGGEEKNGEHTF